MCTFKVKRLTRNKFHLPDNPENLKGAPLSIQVFTQRMQDEECLEIARVVDQCLHEGA